MPIARTLDASRVPVKIWTADVEAQAAQQLLNLANLPFVHSHVAAMPDVHLGIGATVGSVMATKGAIVPAAVGVDIGCGMCAVRTSLRASDLPDNLKKVRLQIERDVPVGRAEHKQARIRDDLAHRYLSLVERHPKIRQHTSDKLWKQLGTLGGGNHFIELCLDTEQRVWVMLHSGSRNVGKTIADYFITRAKETMSAADTTLPDVDLAYLTESTSDFDDYVDAVGWAQDYARENRNELQQLVVGAMRRHLPPFTLEDTAINCHHNYVEREHHYGADVLVTRKGAIRARAGDLGIIPGSMGTRSYIVRGKGNAESFDSCSHGAGRRMSRTQAKQTFDKADVARQTDGVECRKDAGVIDELPGAYKDIDSVMAQQTDLVEIVHTLKQVVCVKG